MAAASGTPEANHIARRRPQRWVMADANGVTIKIPNHVVAANKPARVVDTSRSLSITSISGDSMKTPES